LDLKYPEAVLVDLDDTILSINASVDRCWCDVCARFAERDGGLIPEKLLAAINEARTWYWSDLERHRVGRLNLDRARQEVVEMALISLGINDRTAAHGLADSYSIEIEEATQPFPGAIDTLKHFRRHGVRTALVTNGSSEFQRRKIGRYGLVPLFDFIVIEGEFGFGKPDRRIFQHALDRLSIGLEGAWMIGDDLARDITGAREMGIFSIWVDWQNKGLPASSSVRPDRIVASIAELVNIP